MPVMFDALTKLPVTVAPETCVVNMPLTPVNVETRAVSPVIIAPDT